MPTDVLILRHQYLSQADTQTTSYTITNTKLTYDQSVFQYLFYFIDYPVEIFCTKSANKKRICFQIDPVSISV